MKERYKSYDELPLTLNPEEVAAVLGLSRASAYQLFRAKGFPAMRIGRRCMVCKDNLIQWMDKQSQA